MADNFTRRIPGIMAGAIAGPTTGMLVDTAINYTPDATSNTSNVNTIPYDAINANRYNENGLTFESWSDGAENQMSDHFDDSWGDMTEDQANALYKEASDSWFDSAGYKLLSTDYSATAWGTQPGVMKIVPMSQVQKFSQSVVADIADGVEQPLTQIIPVANVNVIPHHISFDFFDTTEGRFGVSNATEKHMTLECDVYVSELVYYWWQHGEARGKGFSGLDAMQATNEFIDSLGDGKGMTEEEFANKIVFEDFETTEEFMKFRSSLFTQFNGWVLKLVGHTFPTFYCVMTDIKYDISEGETQAKYHLKFEEAIFTEDFSNTGQKPDVQGDESGSGFDSTTNDTTGDAGVGVDELTD